MALLAIAFRHGNTTSFEFKVVIMNRFRRPFFVAKVREMAAALGQPDIFEKWLFDAEAGSQSAITHLKDYGLLPDTLDELRESIEEYVTFINEYRASGRSESKHAR